MIALAVALGAAVGAPARYLTDRAVALRTDSPFPLGTFAVNLVACLVLGLLTGAAAHLTPFELAFAATGLCGALSTFSTFGYETMRLVEARSVFYAVANVVLSVAGGLALAAAGWWLGATLT
ncbi:MAG: fluoride efflux transporter CrcB [Jatrophihabitans sp.]|nr:MAG: fluoride efflux transporter CrcB [Jatrophihabitans sp.]